MVKRFKKKYLSFRISWVFCIIKQKETKLYLIGCLWLVILDTNFFWLHQHKLFKHAFPWCDQFYQIRYLWNVGRLPKKKYYIIHLKIKNSWFDDMLYIVTFFFRGCFKFVQLNNFDLISLLMCVLFFFLYIYFRWLLYRISRFISLSGPQLIIQKKNTLFFFLPQTHDRAVHQITVKYMLL